MFDLSTLIKPDEMEIFTAFLLLLDLNGPETLNSLGFVGAGGVVMAFVGIGFGYAEGEQREREELECVFEGGPVGDFWEEGVLAAGFGVCWRLEGSKCTFDYELVSLSQIYFSERYYL